MNESLCASAQKWAGDRGASWIWGRMQRTAFNGYLPINSTIPDCHAHGRGWFAARSNHGSGVNVGLCDGSVHLVSQSIDLGTWRALCTRAGSEPLNDY